MPGAPGPYGRQRPKASSRRRSLALLAPVKGKVRSRNWQNSAEPKAWLSFQPAQVTPQGWHDLIEGSSRIAASEPGWLWVAQQGLSNMSAEKELERMEREIAEQAHKLH